MLAFTLARDEAPSAEVHAALVADLAERPQAHPLCCVCGNHGEQRGGHVLWPEGPTLCDEHYAAADYAVRSEGIDFERAVSALCMAEDARVAAECEAAQ